jgi:D-serine deaminase-like pyridoxal phosphate-dependent protein
MFGPRGGKSRARPGELALGRIAPVGRRSAALLGLGSRCFRLGQSRRRGRGFRLGLVARLAMLATIAKRVELLADPSLLEGGALKLGLRGFERCIGDPPLGPHCRLSCEQLGERGLGFARNRLGFGELGCDPSRLRFTVAQPLVDRTAFLLELGHRGGRTGCRTVEDALAVARLVDSAPGLRLVGASGYEGTLASRRDEQAVTAVTGFLEKLRDFADALVGEGLVPDEAVVTAGGSIFFDTVIDVLGGWSIASRSRLVLRSGCYLIHDHGLYSAGTPIRHGVVDAPQFRPALSVWARVVSCPESGLALLDAGRRDVSHDAGLPVPLERWRDGESLSLHGERITGLSDQHAFLAWSGERDVREGDLVRLGISHPCTTLDRWRLLLRTDESYNVLGSVQTAF